MRKPLKIYLFFLLLITAFGLLGNVLIQDEPMLNATDINTDIPGSETMVALYEPLADLLSEDRILDIVVMPTDSSHDAELLLQATHIDEATLQADTARVLDALTDAASLSHVTIQWFVDDALILDARFASPFDAVTAQSVKEHAQAYTYTKQ